MQTGYGHSLITLLQNGADATGLGLLAALLAVSAWTWLRPGRPIAGRKRDVYFLLCMLAAPLLMFACLACGLAALQRAPSLPTATMAWTSYRTLVWLLYALVGLQQLYGLQRMAHQPGSQPYRNTALASGMLLLPLAMALGLLALDRACLQQANMPAMATALAALSSISGILLWLPVRLMTAGTEQGLKNGPTRTPEPDHDILPRPAVPAEVLPSALVTALEIETRLGEIEQLLQQERSQADQADQRTTLEADQAMQASTMQQQVNEQRFLFESGLPCRLGVLVNGLIILDQPLDLRDHVRGNSLLHAALREGNRSLAQQLIEHGADIAAVNWAGLSVRACTQDAAILEQLDNLERLPK